MVSNNTRAIRRFNKKVLFNVLKELRSEGIVRVYGPITCRLRRWETASWLSLRGYRGGWCVVGWNYYGFMRNSDIAVTYAGVTQKETKLVAKRIVDALREAGFEVYWDGSIRNKIIVNIESRLWDNLPKAVVKTLSSSIEYRGQQRATA